MAIVVNLWSKRTGEIRKFLERYYEKEIDMDEDVEQWAYIYNKPLNAIDIISALVDNSDKYQISLYIQVDRGRLHHITKENHNDIIKDILYLFYEEDQDFVY